MTRLILRSTSLLLSLTGLMVISSAWISPSFSQTQAEPTNTYTQIFPQTSELALTPEQQSQLTDIAQSTQEQILNLLNPEQQQQLQTDLDNGLTLRDSLRSLGLSSDQRRQMQTTLEATIPEFQAVLTPEQMDQLQSQQGRGFRRRR